ncbi:hypothetical protein O7606_20685 [Micromonospora sp. WMMD882]|uniref:hypothetical protein n=1 Tax=Micromonospora sp. WMMD882 TaxID=3015151 RepID=UPI00248B68AC|nr:hypothetical protein [Micromonospora sp. WMMD882]WBB78611.1 hypothetical protein O7606_20685 [Micromonospora sp. WMMD882]
MERKTTRPMSRGDRVQTALAALFFAGITVAGVLTLAGVITVRGWGDGTITLRLVSGGLYTALGLGALVAAGHTLVSGRMPVPPEINYSGPEAEFMHLVGSEAYGIGSPEPPRVSEF